jgi:hypothetical protein
LNSVCFSKEPHRCWFRNTDILGYSAVRQGRSTRDTRKLLDQRAGKDKAEADANAAYDIWALMERKAEMLRHLACSVRLVSLE